MPPLILVGVVGLAIAGGRQAGNVAVAGTPGTAASEAATRAPASDRVDRSTTDRVAILTPAATRPPSVAFRSRREHGTDGLMGRLPFGLPNDTPIVRVERHDRFVTDDIRPAPHPMTK